MSRTILEQLAAVGGNPEWTLSYLNWQQEKERTRGGDSIGENDKGKTESVSEQ